MKAFHKIVFGYCLGVLPITLIVLLLVPEAVHSTTSHGSTLRETVNTIFGVVWSLWMVGALYIAISLVASEKFRETVLKKVTRIKERDEREELIVGRSSRNTFLFSLGFMLFMLILSTIQIKYEELPPTQVVDGKKRNLSLGLRFDPIVEAPHTTNSNEPAPKIIYNHSIPLTGSGTLMVIILVQLGAFYVYARKLRTE